MMTRKDYIIIAEAVNEATKWLNVKSERACVRLAFHDKLQANYENFDALKFWQAIDTE